MLVFSGVRFIVRSVLLIRVMSFVLLELFVVHFFVVITDPAQGFTWKQFDRGTIRGGQRRHRGQRLLVPMALIVVLKVFEHDAYVQENVSLETNVLPSGRRRVEY